ncbi:MAG: acyl-CoA thioesterase-2 [Gammaproteobacteria bacterium]|jgi:acyl-CoA thioesterase-2
MINESEISLTLPELMTVIPTVDPMVFQGHTEAYGQLGIYGGHFLGQALAAAFETVDEPKLAHSFHAYFLKGGDPAAELHYHVTSLRDSRGGATRAIIARQHGKDVFHMTASFKLSEAGDEHQKTAPQVETAENIIAARKAKGEAIFPFPVVKGGRVEMEFASPSFRDFDPKNEPVLQTWMRVPNSEQLSKRQRQIVLAFLSDGTLMFNSVLPHGKPFETHRLTSLDQCTWFHHDANPESWMLFDQRSTAAADGRGMNEGEIYAADGQIIMTCAQESMLRRIHPPS